MDRGTNTNQILPLLFATIMIIKFGSSMSLPIASSEAQGNLNETQKQEQAFLSREEQNGDYNSNSSKDHVMYSYSEADVSDDGIPSVRQLTIVKGKDGETRFAKNENGTIEMGKWNGTIPSAPSVFLAPSTLKGIEEHVNTVTDPLLAKLNQNIGNSLQDYIMKTFSSFL